MSESNKDLDHPILNLTSQERSAYSHLFALADTDSLGVVTGERAVPFFEKTGIPAPALGEIWQIADTENRGLLTKPGFCMVLRLIGWYQTGQQPSTELAFKPAPLPKFDGITIPGGASQQPASPSQAAFPLGALQPQLSGQSTGGGPIRVPPLDPAKVQQYSGLFERSGAQNGLLEGGTAKSIFERSGLPNEALGKIWMLSDREQRGALDQTEFIVAMHLLTSMKMRQMSALPGTLPQGLYDAAARRGQRPPSRQSSVQTGAAAAIPRQFTGGSIGAAPRTQSPLARPPGYATPPPHAAQMTGTPWLITAQEKAQYDRFFATIDTSNRGIITGDQAVRFFSDSRLSEDSLASIWDLADINSAGELNRDEFAVAMYLIRQQRAPNAAPLPAFLPPALIPPSMRDVQQTQQSTAPSFDPTNVAPAPPAQKSAAEDLFGLDSSPTQSVPRQPSLQPQTTGTSTSRDMFNDPVPASPGSPARFQTQQPTGGASHFRPFMPTSAFGASLAQQTTGQSTTSSVTQLPQATGFQSASQRSAPIAADDLLGDDDTHAEESSRMTTETTELANMSNQIGNLRTQMEATQAKKTTTQADLNATSVQKRDLEQRLMQFRAQYESEVRAVKEMEAQLNTSRESTKKLGQDLAMLEGTFHDLQTQHTTVSQQLQADQQENALLKQKIGELNAEVARLKSEIEKMKLDARQQKGLVSINKKQLATNEGEHERLQSEKADLEREAAEQARIAVASPEPVLSREATNVISPAASTLSSTNPFFRKTAGEGPVSPPVTSPAGPTPSAFDALFGPSHAFAPSGQATSRSSTPPATSFIGRSLPPAAVVGGAGALSGVAGLAAVETVKEHDQHTPTVSPGSVGLTNESAASTEPPPPPEAGQFTSSSLPLGPTVAGLDLDREDAASSTKVMPPASRVGGAETPRELASPPLGVLSSLSPGGFFSSGHAQEQSRETVPGAFPDDETQPSTAEEVSTPKPNGALSDTSQTEQDFDSAFAGFGTGEASKAAEQHVNPFAVGSSQQPAAQAREVQHEFPPIQSLEPEDESDSDEEAGRGGFDDNFAAASPPRAAGEAVATAAFGTGASALASGESRPGISSTNTGTSELPPISHEQSPPTYEQSDDIAHGGPGEASNPSSFPREYTDLLPAREDPTSPPATSSPPAQTFAAPPTDVTEDEITPAPKTLAAPVTPAHNSLMSPVTDVFHDAQSRPISSVTDTLPGQPDAPAGDTTPTQPKNAFDEFDDFNDLSEAKEADKSGTDFDFGLYGRQSSTDEFSPAFDSPAHSMATSSQLTPLSRSMYQSQESNSFANFTPSASTSSAFGTAQGGEGNGNSSIQQTPENAQHDWDAIFSGLDSSKEVDTTLANSDDPWNTSTSGVASSLTTNGIAKAASKAGETGRAITPGTEHDDPILKRLTGMGYPRADALNALERYDYDIDKAVDHLSSN